MTAFRERGYLRHPTGIPISYKLIENGKNKLCTKLKNIGLGGLSFRTRQRIGIGTLVKVVIPMVTPKFEAVGQVRWCRKTDHGCRVGVQFLDDDDAYRTRMVEQVCQIESYRRRENEENGRWITPEQAAAEWIEKYAHQYPQLQ